ncbi:hypothetical protein BDU57DRAFT_140162 [Ampelomyces quisqualis]|uniref:Uncharacterized protein n=1 Tax=Ampelomyces quisqualis TaxID=50730 RepID=A0A6A5QZW0_AMPQU|nr:hypothetical protein BDU57DRAFT_140162 [Ampelomyces quisqualis]
MSTNDNSNASRKDWHLVYIRLDNELLPHRLAIRVESIEIDKDRAGWFSLDHLTGNVNYHGLKFTASKVVQELGWFKDVAIFTQICRNQTVPAGAQPDHVFDLWISRLLQTLATNNQNSWIPNDGCSS